MPRGASGVFQRAHQEAEWAPETPPEEYSGILTVPKCARIHTLDGIEGPERVLGRPQEYSSAQDPKNGTNIEVFREPNSL